eukprot:CAMPEP_0196589906 /NCGR_PEP_ID=MMETSP1081-20130531/64981_1 /TAXON_ID=36882 /ORGANISM="Pyramimonas amylifera, Strain CCMP720" /LENGTH=265 /DNA_ID=CAMNT_0041912843 /DNA_START=135 /DNA_END=932 /DNA_ORIENTATION=+
MTNNNINTNNMNITSSSLFGNTDSKDWNELMNLLLSNPLPASPNSENKQWEVDLPSCSAPPLASSSGLPPTHMTRMTRSTSSKLLLQNQYQQYPFTSSQSPTPYNTIGGIGGDQWGQDAGTPNNISVQEQQKSAKLQFLQKLHSLSRSNSNSGNTREGLVGLGEAGSSDLPTPGLAPLNLPTSTGSQNPAPLSPSSGVRRSPKFGGGPMFQRQNSLKLDPDILHTPAFSQSELNLLLSTLSDVVSPNGGSMSPNMKRRNSNLPFG